MLSTKKFILFFILSLISLQYVSSSESIDEEQKKRLSDQKIESIANLYGHARYYNPNAYLEKLNWYKFLMHTLREAKKVENNNEELASFLYRSFSTIIPNIQIITPNKTFGEEMKDVPKTKYIYFMEHYGFGGKVMGKKMPYYSKIAKKEISKELPRHDSLYSFSLCDSITLRYPLAVTNLDNRLLKNNAKQLKAKIDTIDLRITSSSALKVAVKGALGYSPLKSQDETLRMADIITHWTVLKFFYPYLKEDGLDAKKMRDLLCFYTRKAQETIDLEHYYCDVLREFMGHFKDQHIILSVDMIGDGLVSTYIGTENNKIFAEYVEGNVVSQYNIKIDSSKIIKRGDILVAINDQPIEQVLSEHLKYVSSATDIPRINQLLYFGFETLQVDSIFKYTFKSSQGDTINYFNPTKKPSYKGFATAVKPRNRDFIQELDKGRFLILLSSKDCKVKTFKKFLDDTPDIKSIILDVRKYPAPEAVDLLSFFSEKPIVWGDYRSPSRYFPEQEKTIWKDEKETLTPQSPTVKVPVYALIGASSTSYAESIANTIKKNKLAILVGENTSGTNGNMANARLSLFPFTFSVGKDFDGYHGKGVSPDIEISQTLEDYKKGVDTILECFLKNKIR